MTHSERVCLITGPTSGLGRAIALDLAAKGYRLALLARSTHKLEQLAEECEVLGAPTPIRLVADMSSQAQVRSAAQTFLATGHPLHVLLNNAGLINQRRRITEDDIEETVAVGYFSAFLLTMLLAERLAESALPGERPPMVINTTSDTYPIGRFDLDDVRFDGGYGPITSYAASKLALVSFTKMLAQKLTPHGVMANVYNPGMNYTNLAIGNNSGRLKDLGDAVWRLIASPVEDGIVAPVALITDPAEAHTTGTLFMSGKRAKMNRRSRDPHFGAALWELSERRTGACFPDRLRARSTDSGQVRFGVLGAARIAPFALIKQAQGLPGVQTLAVAEEYQPLSAAMRYARKHRVPRIYRSFDKLLADPDVDAVYLALPTRFHAEWALRVIGAGKHLLCEKPLAANAEEARRIDDAQRGTGLVVAEAMHSLQHPMVERVREILASGELGELQHVSASFSAYIPQRDFRFDYALGGGVLLDMGCYPIALLRRMLGTEPEVIEAKADEVAPNVDGIMRARLAFPNAPNTRLFVAMRSLRKPLDVTMRFEGTRGSLHILNFMKPEVFHRLTIRSGDTRRVERVPGGSTYRAQLESFVAAVRGGPPISTTTAEAVKTLSVVDAIYERAGMTPRRPV